MISDRGSGLPLLLATIAVVALVGVATASLGALFAAREQAFTAAESAALAAAVATYPPAGPDGPPRSEARRAAIGNGANLVSCICAIDRSLRVRTVEVTTRVVVELPLLGRIGAVGRARAEFDPVSWLGR